jgi:hypothetical protein
MIRRTVYRESRTIPFRGHYNPAPCIGTLQSFLVETNDDATLHGREVETGLEVGNRRDVGLRDPVEIDECILTGEPATHEFERGRNSSQRKGGTTAPRVFVGAQETQRTEKTTLASMTA